MDQEGDGAHFLSSSSWQILRTSLRCTGWEPQGSPFCLRVAPASERILRHVTQIQTSIACKELLRGKTVATEDSAEVSDRDRGEIKIVLPKAQGLLGPAEAGGGKKGILWETLEGAQPYQYLNFELLAHRAVKRMTFLNLFSMGDENLVTAKSFWRCNSQKLIKKSNPQWR